MNQKSKINLNMSEKAKIKQIHVWWLAFFTMEQNKCENSRSRLPQYYRL